ncbi:MAG: adenylate/guanylate cyclase domain-containing protein [Anaerolineae bacterium]|jgi:class 3 adenylate cyclase/tetratricopeptide (TPR) repeat protein
MFQTGEKAAPAHDPAGNAQTALPEGLAHYLPAGLWQSLSAGDTRRGLLLNALERLRSILYLLSTYLPAHLVQEKMRRPAPGRARGRMLDGSLLFSDVSGFTALSEQLAALEDGAEQLTGLMNRYFERMLAILSRSGGILLKFAGDALLAYFPVQEGAEQARWAVRAAQRMIEAMDDFDAAAAGPGLQMKVGIGTGRFLTASIGDRERMEYVLLGRAVARTMAAESAAVAGQVVVDEPTAAHLAADRPDDLRPTPLEGGRFAVVPRDPARDLGDFEIKVESRRARGAIPWSASPHAIAAQMEIVLRQIRALEPFLAAELVDRIVAGARQRRVESEYRPTTVLFINFTGLEELLDAWGKKGVRPVTRLLDDYFREMQGIIRQHGGVVSRIDPYGPGSKMLVLFGAPVAHEDDPLRAVTAALAMKEALVALHERWRYSLERRRAGVLPLPAEGPILQHRVGITRGQTFAGQVGSPTRREYTVMGDDVNLAARLMAAAAPGQILISQRVYDAIAGHMEAAALPPVRVKGKSRPIPIYAPTGMRRDPLARRLQGLEPLVGRQAAWAAGQEAVRRALAGRGGLLAIQGPAGVGKSHLAAHLAAYALARGGRASLAECRSYAARTPYAAWIDLLAGLLDVVPGGGDQARDRLLAGLSDLGLKAAEIGPRLCTLLGLPSPPPSPAPGKGAATAGETSPGTGASLFGRLQKKVEVRETGETGEIDLWQLVRERHPAGARSGGMWPSLQARIAARQEEQMQDAVGDLLARLSEDDPLLLIVENGQWLDAASKALLARFTRRLPELPITLLLVRRDGDGISEKRLPGEEILTLGALDPGETGTLLARLLGGQPPAPEVAEAVYRQSGGNPLFVEEIARGMQRVPDDPSAAIGHSTLHDLVLSRLDSLPPGQGRAARAASVAGAHFMQGEVGALLPVADADRLDQYLAGLEEGGLVLPAGDRSGDGTAYTFRQMLVREVIYRSQSFARRRTQHAALAGYMEAQYAACLEGHAERLAHHYEQAGRLLPAARYLLLSGHKAARRYAYDQAIDDYVRALSILIGPPQAADVPQLVTLRAAAYEAIGNGLFQVGHFAAAWAAYDAAQVGLGRVPARLLLKLAQLLPIKGRDEQAREMAARAWAAEVPAAGHEVRLATAATMAWLLWRAGDARAGDWIDRGQALAAGSASGDWVAGVQALLRDLAGDWSAARRAYRRLGRPDGVALAACRLGDRYLAEGDAAGALALFEGALELWAEEGDAAGLALARYRQAEALARQGDWAAARRALQAAGELLARAPLAGDEDRRAIEAGLAAVEAGATGPWPAWHWRRSDDAFRLSMLFRPSFPEIGIPA